MEKNMAYKAPTKKQVVAFKAAANKFLSTLATASDTDEYNIPTTAGPLKITVYDDWLACRFDNVILAKAPGQVVAGNLNIWSGKWNWHGMDTIPAFKKALVGILLPNEVSSFRCYGMLAFQYGGEYLLLQVLESNAGFYIGTRDSEGAPNSRESAIYWKKAHEAQATLDSGNWVQKEYP